MQARCMVSVPPLLASSAGPPQCLTALSRNWEHQQMQTRDTRGRAGESLPCLGKEVAAPGQGGVGRRTGPTRCSQGFQLHRWFPAGESDRGRGFLHRILGNLWWRSTSPLFNLLMRDKTWDGPQHSENQGRVFLVAQIVRWDFRRHAEKEKHSCSSHSLKRFHIFRERCRLFSCRETRSHLIEVVDKVRGWLSTLVFWWSQCEGQGLLIALMQQQEETG